MDWDAGYEEGFRDWNEGTPPRFNIIEDYPDDSYETGYVDGYMAAYGIGQKKGTNPCN